MATTTRTNKPLNNSLNLKFLSTTDVDILMVATLFLDSLRHVDLWGAGSRRKWHSLLRRSKATLILRRT
jgi:hypothetical protein